MNLKYEEIFDYSYQQIINEIKIELVQSKTKTKRNELALKKYCKNKKTLDYLNSNPVIRERSGWQNIRTMKYIDLLRAYFNSEEFEQSIYKLYKKGNQNYINQYIFFSESFVTYFQSYNLNSMSKNANSSTSLNPVETNYSDEMY